MELSDKKIKEHLDKVQEQAWEGFIHHKTQIHKLCFWSAGFVTTLLIVTQLFGAASKNDVKDQLKDIITSGCTSSEPFGQLRL